MFKSLQMFAWFSRMLAACFVASAHHRPAWDVLDLLTSPASMRSRVFFAFSLFLELLVRPRRLRLQLHCSHTQRSSSSNVP